VIVLQELFGADGNEFDRYKQGWNAGRESLMELLRKVEWSARADGEYAWQVCPVCLEGWKYSMEHAPGCKLGEALGRKTTEETR
jgi:hypothetical protein